MNGQVIKKEKKKFNKKGITLTVLGVILCIGIGTGAGYLLATELSPKGVDYSTISSDANEDNVKEIYENYLANTLDPLTYSPNDLANISLYKYSLEEYASSEITSSATSLGVTQTTYGKSIKNQTSYFNESISESAFVKVAKRFYENEEKVDVYNGSIIHDDNGISGEYKDKEELTLKEYEDKWGKTLSRTSIYIISSKTTLESSSVTKQDSGDYLISLDLDPVKSVVRYVKQMVSMSNLSDAPQFDKVHLDITIDKDLNLKEINVKESYNVWVFGKNYTEATLKEKFSINSSETKIPNYDEKLYY